MSTVEKTTATTISMIVLVLSLAVGPTTASGKGNKRTGNTARSQQGPNLKERNVRPSGTSLRSAVSRTRRSHHYANWETSGLARAETPSGRPKGLFANGDDDPISGANSVTTTTVRKVVQ